MQGKIVCKRETKSNAVREELCAFCDGCGIVQNKLCHHCNGHGVLANDSHGLHRFSMTDKQLLAMDVLGRTQ